MSLDKPVRTYREIMLGTWGAYAADTLEMLLKADNERLRDHRRWALICEVNAGYESCPDTRDELEKMCKYHAEFADFIEDEISILLELLEPLWHAVADDGGETQEAAVDAAGEYEWGIGEDPRA